MKATTAADLPGLFATVPPTWTQALTGWTPAAAQDLAQRVRAISQDRPIAPDDPFRALRLTAPDQVRVVILGQDPYPRAGHADGLAFSAAHGRPVSLRRIFAVLAADRPGFVPPASSRLDAWARQGVLLLNPVLTVEVGQIGSHLSCGWQALTSEIIETLCSRSDPPIFLLWGSQAQAFFEQACPTGANPPVLRTRHPSNDFRREFMAQGSHFTATAHLVDWWAL